MFFYPRSDGYRYIHIDVTACINCFYYLYQLMCLFFSRQRWLLLLAQMQHPVSIIVVIIDFPPALASALYITGIVNLCNNIFH